MNSKHGTGVEFTRSANRTFEATSYLLYLYLPQVVGESEIWFRFSDHSSFSAGESI
jgi:hypothetical protein